MDRRGEFTGALAVAATALGLDFVSGRALAALYAQTGRASWLGVAASGLLFGLLTGGLASLARRSGAQGLGELMGRLPGGGLGRGARLIHALIMAAAACMLASAAGEMGALALPIRRARAVGAGLALAIAGAMALCGARAVKAAGGAFVALSLLFEVALLLFGELPAAPRMRYELELRLRDSWAAALLFSALHTAVCLCLSAGVTVKLSGSRARPARLGLWAGALLALLLGLGNGVLTAREEEILALRIPFVALSAGWGGVGFYLSTGLNFLAAATSLAGIAYSLLPPPGRAKFPGK